jgi:acylphosphatase
MTVVSRRAVVTGRVQGVGFRFFAERAARETGVAGWVRNREDGSVETFAEGEEQAVRAYLEKLRVGPRVSRVAALQEEEAGPAGHTTFEITR